ncbi:MAG TPA: T9SS type A sorting domain-containing protein [bacterium]|nr:T9SS type A sorting domain-containing protein [bacterium]
MGLTSIVKKAMFFGTMLALPLASVAKDVKAYFSFTSGGVPIKRPVPTEIYYNGLNEPISGVSDESGNLSVTLPNGMPDNDFNGRVSNLYPCPANKHSTVKIKHPAGKLDVDLVDVDGRQTNDLYEGTVPEGQTKIDFGLPSRIASGCYFLVVKTGSGQYTKKLIVLEPRGNDDVNVTTTASSSGIANIDSVVTGPSSDMMARRVIRNIPIDGEEVRKSIDIPSVYLLIEDGTAKIYTNDGKPVSGADVILSGKRGENPWTFTAKSSPDGSVNFQIPLQQGVYSDADKLIINSARISGNRVIPVVLPLEKIVNGSSVNLGTLNVNQAPSQITINGKTIDVYGDGISADDITAYFTVNRGVETVKGSSDANGNFTLIYSVDSSKVGSGFSINADSVVFKGNNPAIPGQSVKLSGSKDVNLGNVPLDNLVDVRFNVLGLLDSTFYSPKISAIGLRDTLDVITQNGFAELKMFAGQYRLIVQESDKVYEMKLGLFDVKGNNQTLPVFVVDKINFTPLQKEVFEKMFKMYYEGGQACIMTEQPHFYIDIRNIPEGKKHWPGIIEKYIKGSFAAGLNGFLVNPVVEVGTNPPEYGTKGIYVVDFLQFSNPESEQAATSTELDKNTGIIFYARSTFHNQLPDSVFLCSLPHELFTGLNDAGRFAGSVGPYAGIFSVINFLKERLDNNIYDLTPWDRKSWMILEYLGPGQKKGFEQRDFSKEITIGPTRTYSVDELIQAGIHPAQLRDHIERETNRDLSRFKTPYLGDR